MWPRSCRVLINVIDTRGKPNDGYFVPLEPDSDFLQASLHARSVFLTITAVSAGGPGDSIVPSRVSTRHSTSFYSRLSMNGCCWAYAIDISAWKRLYIAVGNADLHPKSKD